MMLHAWSLKFYAAVPPSQAAVAVPGNAAAPTCGVGQTRRGSLLGFAGDAAFVAPDPLSPFLEEE